MALERQLFLARFMAKLRILLVVVFLVIVSLVWLAISYRTKPLLPAIDLPPTSPVAVVTPLPPEPEPTPSPEETNFVGQVNLIIPVAGVRPDQLLDTFDDARSEGRVHDAIDIMAPAETPVLAAANGKILKLFNSERGGTTIYQLNTNQDLVFYYAHLSRYADGLAEGNIVKQGEVIAYVGDTGNAGAGNYHLHFSITTISDPKRYWEGTNINPYPLLHDRTR
jgi:murein DD-endopeptidase MepM/ murein hydrolase activator NlpD